MAFGVVLSLCSKDQLSESRVAVTFVTLEINAFHAGNYDAPVHSYDLGLPSDLQMDKSYKYRRF